MIAVGYLSSMGRNSKINFKIIILFILLLYGFYFLALSTRRIAIIPFAILALFFQQRKKISYLIGFPVSVYSSLILMNFVLTVRGELQQGLASYIHALNSANFVNIEFLSIFQNFIASFQITGITAFLLDKYPMKDLFIEIDPLPGNLAGWYQILFRHSINSYTPTSSVGDLANYGMIVFIPSIIIFSFFGMRLSSILVQALTRRDTVLVGLIISGVFITVFNSLQYSLRSSVRLFYYSSFLYFIILGYRKFFRVGVKYSDAL
jgi:hypothetical protein